jgi:histone deacetylase 6
MQGGYTLESISNCALAVGRMLLGEAPPEMSTLVASEVEAETVWLVAKEQSKYWKSINVRSCEPSEGLKSAHLYFQGSFPLSDFEELVFDVPGASTASVFLSYPSINVFAEILKAHRQDYMYSTFGMLEVPLMHDDVREKFSAQVMCS